jgi:photosystem II stability/assembly factor-like uncharacterized protein
MHDNLIGFAFPNDGSTIVKTTDGGSTWTNQTSNVEGATTYDSAFWDMHVINETTAIGVGLLNNNSVTNGATIWRTSDGGNNWNIVWQSSNSTQLPDYWEDLVSGVDFPENDSVGFAIVSYRGTILKTTNGGVSWTRVGKTPWSTTYFPDIKMHDNLVGFAWNSDNGTIVKTVDGGVTWPSTYINTNLATIYDIRTYEENGQIYVQAGGFVRNPSNYNDKISAYSTSSNGGASFQTATQLSGDRLEGFGLPPLPAPDEIQFQVSNAFGTVKAELKSGSTVISTQTGLNNGVHKFTNVSPGTYTIKLTEEANLSCTTETGSKVIEDLDPTPIVCTNGFSQVNGATSSSITWSASINTPQTSNITVTYLLSLTGTPGSTVNYITINAGQTTGTKTNTISRVATARTATMTIQDDVPYDICANNTQQATIPAEDVQLGRLFWTTESNNTGVWEDFTVTGGGQNEFVADGVSNYEVFTADTNAGTFVFKGGGGNFVINDELAINVERRPKQSTGSWNTFGFGSFFVNYTSTTQINTDYDIYDYRFTTSYFGV